MKTHILQRTVTLVAGLVLLTTFAPACSAQANAQSGAMFVPALTFQRRLPDWAVGRFKGRNRKYATDLDMTISTTGRITGIASDRNDSSITSRFSGYFRDGRITIKGQDYEIDQIMRGIRLIQVKDKSNTVNMAKISDEGGYNPDDGSGGGGSGQRAPSWAIGRFSGYNNKFDSDIEVIVTSNGGVTENIRQSNGKNYTYNGILSNGRVTLDNHVFDIGRETRGIRLTQVNDHSNTVSLDRQGGSGGGGNGGSGDRPPRWATGRFKGYNNKYDSDIEMIIASDGSVTENIRQSNGKNYTVNGSWRDGRLTLDNNSFEVRQEDTGIRVTQIGERTNTVSLDRQGGSGGGGNGGGNGDRPPSWAVGSFRGHNDKYAADIELTITANGRITQIIRQDDGRQYTVSGAYRDDRLQLDNNSFDIRREGSGIRVTQIGERSNTVLLRRR